MKFPFPLFVCSGPILSLDDEAIFHRLLARVLPRAWEVRYFTDQAAFSSEITRQLELQEQGCKALEKMIKACRDRDASVIYDLARYWAQAREAPASVAMIDFRMPYATGVELLAQAPLADWSGNKLLMTAHADDSVAVDAFNQGLISQFVSKGLLGEAPGTVIELIELMRKTGNRRIEQAWSAQVLHGQQDILDACRPGIEAIAKEEGWREYAVIGEPFGILGRNAAGQLRWLQLETDSSLSELCEVLENLDVAQGDIQAVRNRSVLMAPEVGIANFGSFKNPAIELGKNGSRLLGGLFDIELSA